MKISISIVSHGQGELVKKLLDDLRRYQWSDFEIILTINIPESVDFISDFADLDITVIQNPFPKGFGDNHNSAFSRSNGDIFLVLNPDIRAPDLNFTNVSKILSAKEIGVCGVKVLNGGGGIEDSARRFPTILSLFRRKFFPGIDVDYDLDVSGVVKVDWVAGMFMAFSSGVYRSVGGFDEQYYMYMEDADICRRLARRGYLSVVDCSTVVIHDAQRASRKSLRHFRWHLRSALRFLVGI